MNIVVINGTEKHGITYNLKEIFLRQVHNGANITEFYLPRDCNCFCCGCTACFSKGEKFCKDFVYVNVIKQAILKCDLLVFAYPVYVFHTPGAVKAFLDHLGHMWIVHRPEGAMFGKRAVIITQSLGAGTSSAFKDVKDSLSWWGISKIYSFKGSIMDSSIVWDELSEKRKNALSKGIVRLGKKIKRIDFSKPARTSFIVKMKFFMVRLMQKSIIKSDIISIDAEHWKNNGWLEKKRPWK